LYSSLSLFSELFFLFSLLVFVHELGHFFAARIFKMRVPKFYLFFNPSVSLVRCKKINGKWHFKFLGKNLPETLTETDADGNPVLDEKGKPKQKMLDLQYGIRVGLVASGRLLSNRGHD